LKNLAKIRVIGVGERDEAPLGVIAQQRIAAREIELPGRISARTEPAALVATSTGTPSSFTKAIGWRMAPASPVS
jgi:hypothetical protein